MAFDIPRGEIFRVDEIDVRLDPTPHPFAVENGRAIADNWATETAANPSLYDGKVALLAELAYRGRRLAGRCHIVDYSTLMYWRRLRPFPTAEHAYAHAIPVTRDNALVAVRMAGNTVGAGLIYFAAGSFEPEDFVGGRVDVGSNMIREVREETGVDLADTPRDAAFHALSLATGTVIFRRHYLDETAEELAERIADFVRRGGDPEGEIDGPVVIRDAADLPDRLAVQMPALIGWHFASSEKWPERSASPNSW